MKQKQQGTLSEPQLEIMRQVWAGGEVTVTQVWEALNQGRSVARNTIHTQMDRMVRRGWLKRRLDAQTHHYSAQRSRTSTLQSMVGRMVDAAFGGSVEELVSTLVQNRRLSTGEIDRIRKLIEQAKTEKP